MKFRLEPTAAVPGVRLRPLVRRRRVPFVEQTSQADCGAACLAMVLAAYGKHVPLKEIRDAIVSDRDGTSAAAIAQASEHFGLRVEGVSADLKDLERLDLPLILHWDFQHFVVLERWNGRKGRILDPAAGRLAVEREFLDRNFTGVALQFEPAAGFQKTPARRRNWSRYSELALTARGAFASILSLSLMLQVLGLALPIATALVVDRLLPRRMSGGLSILAWGAMAFAVAYAVATMSRSRMLVTLQARFSERLSLDFFRHLLELPFGFFQSRSTGDLILRLGSNAVLREILSQQALSVIFDAGLLATYAAILTWRAPYLGIGVLLLASLETLATLLSLRLLARLSAEEVQAQSASESFLVESLRGIETIKAFSAEKRVFQRGEVLMRREIAAGARRQRKALVVQTILTATHFASPLLLLAIGAATSLEGELPLGAMLGSLALAGACLAPLSSLLANVQNLQRAGVHFDRIEEVLEEPREQEERKRTAGVLRGDIEFDRVTLTYGPLSPPAVCDISFKIRAGEMVAIVGRSGSGKSTLAKLLLGLYRPTAGRVLLDGCDLTEVNLRSVREQIGTVLQGGFLFQETVRRNIALTHPDLSDRDLRRAAHMASIAETVEAMPMGYDTQLSEMGSNLSGGQRQRLCIARALAGGPRIVLLDEATSELDTLAEAIVYRNLADLQITRIVIAHRLSTVRHADRIFVLEGGRLVEAGSHAALLRERGMYASLLQTQDAAGPAA